MKVFGLCGSPIKNGNAFHFLSKALEPLQKTDLEVEIAELAKKDISDCMHCNWCMKNKTSDKICAIEDDGEEILQKIKAADVLVVASPAYYGRMTGRLASILDRTRPLLFSKPHKGAMTDKPGVALSVGWGRNAGSETTLLSIVYSFLVLEMLPVSHYNGGAIYGASGLSNPALLGVEETDKRAVTKDDVGIFSAQSVVKRACDLAGRIIR